MAIFWPKPWVNPFGKMSTSSTFWNSWLYNLDRRFFVLEYRKRHFPGLHCFKKKVGKMTIFRPKPWVTPLEKCQFFDFWTFCFFRPERRFFDLEYRTTHFPALYFLKNKSWKHDHFLTKTMEKRKFFDFSNFLFL